MTTGSRGFEFGLCHRTSGVITDRGRRNPAGNASVPVDQASERWYACHTRARCEKRVAQLLLDRDIGAYLPTMSLVRTWADRRKVVEFPLFPSYVFARFGLQELHRVLSVPGVATVVRTGGRPVPIPTAEIDNVRRVATALAGTRTLPEPQPLRPGEDVRVIGGPFRGVTGVVTEVRGRRRVLVGLHAIGLGISIDLDTELLQALA